MEGYFVDEEPRRESQGEWSQNSEWMQRVSIPNFRENQNSISRMLQGPNLLPSTFSAFHPPPLLSMTNYSQGGQLDSHQSYVRAEMFEEKEETEGAAKNQLVGRKRGRVTKEATKKMKKGDKKNTIEIGESEEEEEEMSRIKWKDFEVYHLIAIRGEMDEEFTKTANKQGNIFLDFYNLL
jgi:hypothetical protein